MNLDQFEKNLLAIIDTEAIINEGSAVISLDAEFGMGKSFFLEEFKDFLTTKNKKCLKINSWESDFYKNPLIAILCELIDFFEEVEKDESITKKVKEILKNVSKLFFSLADQAIEFADQVIEDETGVSVTKAVKDATKPSKDLLILENFRSHKNILNDLKKVFNEYLKDNQLIILVDELDRTRPAYAVEFLEALKHFFDIKNLIFVLAVNKKQLKASVQCLYGDINFDEYYRKFSSQTISLPYLEENLKNYITKKSDEIFNKFSGNIGFDKDNIQTTNTARSVIEYLTINLKISLRLLNDFFKDLVVFLNNEKGIKIGFESLMCFIIYKIFSLKNSEFGEKILTPNFNYEDFLKFCKDNNISQDCNEFNTTAIFLVLGISENQTVAEEIFEKYKINNRLGIKKSLFNSFSLRSIANEVAIGKNILEIK